jgi:hypothetical protein
VLLLLLLLLLLVVVVVVLLVVCTVHADTHMWGCPGRVQGSWWCHCPGAG